MSGMSDTYRMRKVWRAMLARCRDTNDPAFKNYGGRGIRVCERWQRFEHFLADMGVGARGLTLERIDNDGPYSPGNCRWATRVEQCRNTRHNRLITYRGETLCLAEWAERLGFSEGFIRRRMDVQGLSFHDAVTRPKRYSVWRRSREVQVAL